MIELIGATTTRTGLTVHADADTGSYPRGINISDAHLAAIAPQLKLDKFHGEWNVTGQVGWGSQGWPSAS